MNELQQALNEKDYLKAKRLILDNPKYLEENVELFLEMIEKLSPKKLTAQEITEALKNSTPTAEEICNFVKQCGNYKESPEDHVEQITDSVWNQAIKYIDTRKKRPLSWNHDPSKQLNMRVQIDDENKSVDATGINTDQLTRDVYNSIEKAIIGDPNDKNGPPNPKCAEKTRNKTCMANHPAFQQFHGEEKPFDEICYEYISSLEGVQDVVLSKSTNNQFVIKCNIYNHTSTKSIEQFLCENHEYAWTMEVENTQYFSANCEISCTKY